MKDLVRSLIPSLKKVGIDAGEAILLKWEKYLTALALTNKKINLVGRGDTDLLPKRHLLDSLFPYGLLPAKGAAIGDLGSGGGFPGIPLAILMTDNKFSLIEPREKRAAFLGMVILELGLDNCTVVEMRAEQMAKKEIWRERFDCITARSVAGLPELLEYALPLIRVGGKLLAWKGPRVSEEIKNAKNAIKIMGATIADQFYYEIDKRERVVLVVEKDRKTPPQFPRSTGRIKKKPL